MESESEQPEPDKYWIWLSEWMRDTIGIDPDGKILSPSENDWMLIIKLHAMIEAALNSTLLLQFGVPELDKIISKLDTSNSTTGKVAFAKALQVLRNQSVVFIQKLSELRNLCVHDIRNFKFNFIDHLSKLDKGEREGLLNIIAKEIQPEFEFKGVRMTGKDLAKLQPRFGLVVATMNVLMQTHFYHSKLKNRDLTAELCRLKAEHFDKQEQSNPTVK